MSIFWAITAYTFFSSGGRNNGSLMVLFTLAAIGAWVWAILTIRSQQTAGKSLAELQALSPDVFEDWTAARFRDLGYSVKTTGMGGDHGVDLILEKGGQTAVVQCKNYKAWPVGEPVLRDLYGAMHDHRADRAYLVTSGRLTQAATKWVQGKPIEVWDGDRLVKLSAELATKTKRPKEKSPLTALAVEGAPTAVAAENPGVSVATGVACPDCGSTLVQRRNRRTGEAFWGCSAYPQCRYTKPE